MREHDGKEVVTMNEMIAYVSKHRSAAFVVSVVLAMVEPAAASTPDLQPHACVFDAYMPRAVEPYYVEQNVELGHQVLRGAALFVPARAGLTKEWLELSIRNAFASQSEARSICLPSVRNVEIAVGSAGVGFWVYLGSSHAPEELLRWAKAKLKRVPK